VQICTEVCKFAQKSLMLHKSVQNWVKVRIVVQKYLKVCQKWESVPNHQKVFKKVHKKIRKCVKTWEHQKLRKYTKSWENTQTRESMPKLEEVC